MPRWSFQADRGFPMPSPSWRAEEPVEPRQSQARDCANKIKQGVARPQDQGAGPQDQGADWRHDQRDDRNEKCLMDRHAIEIPSARGAVPHEVGYQGSHAKGKTRRGKGEPSQPRARACRRFSQFALPGVRRTLGFSCEGPTFTSASHAAQPTREYALAPSALDSCKPLLGDCIGGRPLSVLLGDARLDDPATQRTQQDGVNREQPDGQ